MSDFIAIEDGYTFLSQGELDKYRTQKAEMEYEVSQGG